MNGWFEGLHCKTSLRHDIELPLLQSAEQDLPHQVANDAPPHGQDAHASRGSISAHWGL